MNEFDLIAQFFTRPAKRAILGVGDDCALIAPTPNVAMAISTDTLVEGRHFLPSADPCKLGHKALAVNLSDLAAMGATPRYLTLALSIPKIDETWLQEFSRGLFALADDFQCELIGGDTVCGPLSITITVFGEVPQALALRRDAAKVGDDLWVSGELGDAALALWAARQQVVLSESDLRRVSERLDRPMPRVSLGLALRSLAHAAIDISDGLIGDVKHILQRSHLGADIWLDAIPLSAMMLAQTLEARHQCALSGGDDYELCFTAPPSRRADIAAVGAELDLRLTRIGGLTQHLDLRLLDHVGQPIPLTAKGFDHFV